jgi:hypothetical protein
LWAEPDSVRILFITLLAMCDKDGYVYGSRIGIERAAMIFWNKDEDPDPWEVLLSPDKESSDKIRAPENEGRRIEEVSGGFRLLNFEYYRGLRNDDDRREQNRRAQAKFKEKAKVSQGKPPKASASLVKPPKAHTEAEAEAEAEADKKKETPAGSPSVVEKSKKRFEPPSIAEVAAYCFSRKNSVDPTTFMAHYTANGWVQASGQKIKNWKAAVVTWEKNHVNRKTSTGTSQPIQHQQVPSLTPPK